MDTDSVWFEELWKSNHPPSDEAAQEVKRLLLTPLKDLKDLEAEILELKMRLSKLESRRDETQKRVFRYQSILAPIRRVPADVLGEIFYHCLPTHRNPTLKSTDFPPLLTQICWTWRSTAFSLPELWDRLHIDFTDHDSVPDLETAAEMARNGKPIAVEWRSAQPRAEKQRATQELRGRYEEAKKWILRSGARPLSISISLETTTWYAVPYSKRPPSVTMEFFSLLSSLAPRWKEFSVQAPLVLSKILEDMLLASQMTALTSLNVDLAGLFSVRGAKLPPTPKLLSAPNLRKISTRGDISDVLWRPGHQSFIQWDKLTHVSCFNILSMRDTVLMLQQASNLVEYNTVISDTSIIPSLPGDALFSLPFLQVLSITEHGNPIRMGDFYGRIDAPKLQSVMYTSRFQIANQFSAHNPALIPLVPLLCKSTELTFLSIDAFKLSVWDIDALLRVVPYITHLVLGNSEERAPDRHAFRTAAYLDYEISGNLRTPAWSVDGLVVNNSPMGSENDSDTLLPRLISLVIASPDLRLSDDTLFNMIKSRTTSKKVAVLKRLKLILYRERERDIVEELTAYAEAIGLQVDLVLDYVHRKRPRIDTLLDTLPAFSEFFSR